MSSPRRYSRYDAVHLVSTTLARFQVELMRDNLHHLYPETNFGYEVVPRHEDPTQAKGEIDRAFADLVDKFLALGMVRIHHQGLSLIQFQGPRCNYSITVERSTTWDNKPMLDIGIFTEGRKYRF